MKKVYKILIVIASVIFMWLIGYIVGRNHPHVITERTTDTLVVVDTHIIEKPVMVERTIKESLLVAVHDTTRIRDTLYMPLQKESKTYKGDDYLARVSGYDPSLDHIEVFPKTMVVSKTETTTPKPKLNSIGIGMETSYMNTLSTPIYLEYERMLHKNISFYGQVFYDLPSQRYGAGIGVKMQIEW